MRRGLELEAIREPLNVRVLILAESKTSPREFYLIRGYSNLLKLDLSYNRVTCFPAGFSFKDFPALRTLFLHYNKFSSLRNLVPVAEVLPANPVAQPAIPHAFWQPSRRGQIPSLFHQPTALSLAVRQQNRMFRGTRPPAETA
jgi:Leucine Rich repeats (2 copies)